MKFLSPSIVRAVVTFILRLSLANVLVAISGLVLVQASEQAQPHDQSAARDPRVISGSSFVTCSPGPRVVCDANNAEDLVRLPGTPWVIASHYTPDDPKRPLIDSIDIRTREVRPLYPAKNARVDWDPKGFRDCSSPPEAFLSGGLNLKPLGQNRFRLYVVNMLAGRYGVELLDVVVEAGGLRAIWRGCLPAPAGFPFPNAVVPLRDGGLVLSGNEVAVWHPAGGWKTIEGISDGNGVEVSRDGSWLYVALWESAKVVRVPVSGGKIETLLDAGFHPDNLRWGEDGGLYAAGTTSKQEFVKCFAPPATVCDTGFAVARLDPETGVFSQVLRHDGIKGEFGGAGTALRVGKQLWLASGATDRIMIIEPK